MSKGNKKEDSYTIGLFLKFGAEKHIRDLYENGTIYLNSIQYFRKVEDRELRGDKYEGASKIVNSLPGTFRIPGIDQDFRYEKVQYVMAHEEILGNIYSLYCVSSFGFPNPVKFRIDKRMRRFGSHGLLIKDNAYFLERITDELQTNGLKFHHGFVHYYDKEKVSKDLTLFEKPMEFEYQKEFRFYVENDEIRPIKIQLGSLKNYAEVYSSKELLQLKLTPKSSLNNSVEALT